MSLPDSLDGAVCQAQEATKAALKDGHNRLQIEIILPDLNIMAVARQYLDLFTDQGEHLKVFFADAGAAALARRDWGETAFSIRGVSELLEPVQAADQAVVIIAPTPVEVTDIEKMCLTAGDRPFILLNPKLQDVAIVGIGYAGRQLRERFLNTLEPCYYLRPLAENTVLFRAYPAPWQIWRSDPTEQFQCLAEFDHRPSGEEIERCLIGQTPGQFSEGGTTSFWSRLNRFLRALSR